jgi:hypothetical protein
MTKKLKHYLVTIDLIGPYRMHGYVMTDDRRNVVAVAGKMADHLEQQKFRFLGVVLMTELSADGRVVDPISVELVRKIACELDPTVGPTIEAAKDFHCTTWLMPKDHPSDRLMMDLH